MKLDYISPRVEFFRCSSLNVLVNWSNTQMDDFEDGGSLEGSGENDFTVVEDPTTPKRVHH